MIEHSENIVVRGLGNGNIEVLVAPEEARVSIELLANINKVGITVEFDQVIIGTINPVTYEIVGYASGALILWKVKEATDAQSSN